jgi:hypothetical protein
MTELFGGLDDMVLKGACPVRGFPARATAGAEMERAFEVAEFNPEASERRKGVNDEPTAIASVVVGLDGVRARLNRTVDTDRMRHSLRLPPGMGLAELRPRWRLAKRTPGKRLLH